MSDQSVGELRGIPASLLGLLNRFSSSYNGVCWVSDEMQLVLPVPDWHLYAWTEALTANILATQTALETVFTVPTDERVYLDYVLVARATGDNLINNLAFSLPTGYFGGTQSVQFYGLNAGAALLYWPDTLDVATINNFQMPGPLLLEPGTIVQIDPTGAGSAASTWTVVLLMRRTKLIRARPPQ